MLGAYVETKHQFATMQATVPEATVDGEPRKLWHRRLRHIGYGQLDSVSKVVTGITLSPAANKPFCEPCTYGKQHRRLHRRTIQRAMKPLARVHVDFWGPYRLSGTGGQRYILTITDDYSRKTWASTTEVKSNARKIFEAWQKHTEAKSRQQILAICCDNAPELKKLFELVQDHSGIMELTVPYTPEQNGVAECINRTIIEKTKTMLIDSNLPQKL